MWRFLAFVCLTGLASCGPTQARHQADDPAVNPVAPPPVLDESTFAEIDLQLGTSGPSFEEVAPDLRLEAFLDSRLEQSAAYENLLPLLFSTMRTRPTTKFVPLTLSKGATAGQDYYFLSVDGDCKGKGVERVTPWWDRTTEVGICPKSYQPQIESETHAGSFHYCESLDRRPPGACRCGPNLVNCVLDGQMATEVTQGLRNEMLLTFVDAIRRGAPFGSALTGNSTMQSAWAVRMYERSEYLRTRQWPEQAEKIEEVSMRQRPEHYQGGVLSSPWIAFFDEGPRITVATLWEDFLCVPLHSTSVNAKDVIHEASDPQLRLTGHMALVTKNVCSNCHARLEHGMLALSSFTTTRVGMRYVPAAEQQTMRFFLRDLNSERESGPATPAYLGDVFRRQPEFAECVVDKVVSAVYRGTRAPAAVRAGLLERFRGGQDFRRLLKGAFQARFQPAPRSESQTARGRQ